VCDEDIRVSIYDIGMCAVDIRVSIYDIDMCVEDISCSVMQHQIFRCDVNTKFRALIEFQICCQFSAVGWR